MDQADREYYWSAIEDGSDPLLSALHSMCERWSLPAVAISLSQVAKMLSEDVEAVEGLSPQQRSLIISSCAAVADLGDRLGAEMQHFTKKS
jgi:hypothetical protein